MSRLCVIPARGGSKRIPRKNVRPFCGKPILAYSIEAATSTGLFDEVMVSTDDGEIADVARSLGASVPFLRDPGNADDRAPLAAVVLECLERYATAGASFDSVLCLLATAPFATASRIADAYERFSAGGYDSFMPVVRFSFPILRAMRLSGDQVSMMWPEHRDTRSQDLEPAYHDSGTFYWIDVARFLEERAILMPKTGGMEIPETEAQDIDTEEDWRLAELKFAARGE